MAKGPERRWIFVAGALAGLALFVGFGFYLQTGDEAASPQGGLPIASHYHSLLVEPGNARALLLGTHGGLYRSADGGRSWAVAELQGQDAMNLSRPGSGGATWVAGHNVLAKSLDGGKTWTSVRPPGLPSTDVHGFAVAPGNAKLLYAAIAGEGLYRSRDGGDSFSLASSEVGGDVFALALTPTGGILAGDAGRGLLASEDGGKTWKLRLEAGIVGLAVNPADPKRVLATGPGISLSTDGGQTWTQVVQLPDGAGPGAWAPSSPKVGYVVDVNRRLLRTADAGETWAPVS